MHSQVGQVGLGHVGQLQGSIVGLPVMLGEVGQVQGSHVGQLVGEVEQPTGLCVGHFEQSVGHLEQRLELAFSTAFFTFLLHCFMLIVSSMVMVAFPLILVITSSTTFTMLFTLIIRNVRTTRMESSNEMTTLPGL